jgi:hypothetical protein
MDNFIENYSAIMNISDFYYNKDYNDYYSKNVKDLYLSYKLM